MNPISIGAHTLIHGDCLKVLPTLPENSVDSIVTDPPYELGFMSRKWDSTGIAFDPETWRHALRVLKPGGHMLAFGGSRTFHRIACAIEDAGFEIRDTIMWLYGSGFPKSKNLDGDWHGWGTALKPAFEPIVLGRKPLIGTVAANVLEHGTGALNIDECRIATSENLNGGAYAKVGSRAVSGSLHAGSGMNQPGKTVGAEFVQPSGRWPANVIHDGSDEVLEAFPDAPGQMAAISGTAPSTKTSNVYGKMRREGEASANSDNLGAVGFKMKPGARRLDAGSAARFFYCAKASRADRNHGCDALERRPLNWSSGDQNPGSFQGTGTDKMARNDHPTVKPTTLMRYLVRLITPPGGTALDLFAGSGSTGRACALEGFASISIEQDKHNCDIAEARIRAAVDLSQVEAEQDAQGDLFAQEAMA